ncbi:hypothetical protein BGX27_001511, partial [Mortierella sp. AM989]
MTSPADMLIFWQVSLKINDDNEEKPVALREHADAKKLRQTTEISEVFGTAPPKKTIHVIIERPSTPEVIRTKLPIEEAFSLGLQMKPPKPLLAMSGASWEYQAYETLLRIMRDEIGKHCRNFRAGHIDKSTMSVYLFLSGSGTGKSRNASEFHNTAIQCVGDTNNELRGKLEAAWVFHVSLENGFSLRPLEKDPLKAIRSRMLHQLLDEVDLGRALSSYIAPDPIDVINVVAKHYNQDLRESTVILVIDGMQEFMVDYEDALQTDSNF